jgi:hypothetical protein
MDLQRLVQGEVEEAEPAQQPQGARPGTRPTPLPRSPSRPKVTQNATAMAIRMPLWKYVGKLASRARLSTVGTRKIFRNTSTAFTRKRAPNPRSSALSGALRSFHHMRARLIGPSSPAWHTPYLSRALTTFLRMPSPPVEFGQLDYPPMRTGTESTTVS